jgi:undecaprenyl pyrophosphate synthase
MFFETLWPEFGDKELNQAVEEFSKRKRTYGKA